MVRRENDNGKNRRPKQGWRSVADLGGESPGGLDTNCHIHYIYFITERFLTILVLRYNINIDSIIDIFNTIIGPIISIFLKLSSDTNVEFLSL